MDSYRIAEFFGTPILYSAASITLKPSMTAIDDCSTLQSCHKRSYYQHWSHCRNNKECRPHYQAPNATPKSAGYPLVFYSVAGIVKSNHPVFRFVTSVGKRIEHPFATGRNPFINFSCRRPMKFGLCCEYRSIGVEGGITFCLGRRDWEQCTVGPVPIFVCGHPKLHPSK